MTETLMSPETIGLITTLLGLAVGWYARHKGLGGPAAPAQPNTPQPAPVPVPTPGPSPVPPAIPADPAPQDHPILRTALEILTRLLAQQVAQQQQAQAQDLVTQAVSRLKADARP